MNREETRSFAENNNFNYDNITLHGLNELINLLNEQFKIEKIKMTCSRVLKNDFKFDRKGMIEAYIKVNGAYFKKRECISFNKDGFIGFAGWADSGNLSPITNAFCKWVDSF